jgi:RimJ/RimL family protein N-acetyltransferase
MLKGDLVVLRAVERSDLPHLCRWRNDPELEGLVHGPPRPRSLAALEEEFERQVITPAHDVARFVVELNGELVGRCDLFAIDQTSGVARIGITIDRPYWGRGLGRDVVTTLLRYAFHDRNLRRVWLDVLADNERAIRSYRACGFLEEGRLREHTWHDGQYKDMLVMAVLRAEWPDPPSPA